MRRLATFALLFAVACASQSRPPVKPLVAEDGTVLPDRAVRPKAIERVEPQFPLELVRSAFNERVTIEAVVGADGALRDVRYVSGNREMMPAVIAALPKWRFEPATLDGKPVAVRFEMTVSIHSFRG